ncbi:hypothetical protein HDU86_000710 [Geranomyces michiganensis]|nr:hypothetical protein HDU86_000710 [Geranomyces michiganensis]
MSDSQRPQQPGSNRVYIPPRRNVPARSGGSASAHATVSYAAPATAPQNELNRAYTTPGPQIAPRTSSGGTVSIPSRGASAQAFPDRSSQVNPDRGGQMQNYAGGQGPPLSNRMSFVPPPRRPAPDNFPPQPQYQQQYPGPSPMPYQPSPHYNYYPPQPYQPPYQAPIYDQRPSSVFAMPTPAPVGGFTAPPFAGPDPYLPQQPYPNPQPAYADYSGPSSASSASISSACASPGEAVYLTPTQAFPEPQLYAGGPSVDGDTGRRPTSLQFDSESPPRRGTHRHTVSESSITSADGDDQHSRLHRQTSDLGHQNSNSPFIPPRPSGFMIPLRNASVQKPNIDTLLDEGAMAFAAPRHNINEALAKWRQARELAVKEKDLLREAKALSNMGCALRNLGHLQEGLSDLRESWDLSTRYVEEAAWKSNSLWLQLVMRHADIDSDVEPEDTGLVNSSTSSRPSDESHDCSQGPPIVVWFLQLTTNLGNAHYCLGQYQEAIQYHDMCKRLAEAVLEEYPLPAQFTLGNLPRNASSASLPKASWKAADTAGESGDGGSTVSNNNSTASVAGIGPSTKTKIKLSYLHRQTLLAESRSLTHLGLCHQQLGLDDEALETHQQAESIVSFYSARLLLASTSTRKASLSNPQDISTEVSAAEAATVANLGTSYHAKGRVPLALEHHQRAAKLFSNIGDRLSMAKEEANIGCLHIEVGKVVNALQWTREMEHPPADASPATHPSTARSHDLAQELDLEECRKYWGPPRLENVNWGTGAPDELAPEIIGQPLFDQGILALYEAEKVFRETDDWIGRDFVFANLAVGYVLLHQPYLALYYLSRLVHEPSTETRSADKTPPNLFTSGVTVTSPDGARRARGIPTFLFPHVFFTLTQALFILTRLQLEQPNRPLFAPSDSPATTLDHGTGIPVMAYEPVERLLRAMELTGLSPETVNDETLTETIEGCRAVLDGIIRLRSQTAETAMYAAGHNAETKRSEAIPCLDVVRQKLAIATATCGKIAWVLASSRNDAALPPESFSRLYFEEGQGAFAKFVADIIGNAGAPPAELPFASSSEPMSPPKSPQSQGVVGTVLTLAHKLLQPPSSDNASRQSSSTLATLTNGNHPSPLLASVFALTADLVAYALHQHTRDVAAGLDLLALLGVPTATSVTPSPSSPIVATRDTLLAAATRLYAAQIGVCEPCALDFVRDLERFDGDEVGDVVFRSKKEAEALKRATGGAGAAAAATGPTMSPNQGLRIGSAVGVFPCPHYTWDD